MSDYVGIETLSDMRILSDHDRRLGASFFSSSFTRDLLDMFLLLSAYKHSVQKASILHAMCADRNYAFSMAQELLIKHHMPPF